MSLFTQNLKGHAREIILGPLFKLLEAVLELFVPLVTAHIIDIGVKNSDSAFIIQRGFLLLALAILGAAAGLTCQYFAAVAAGHFGKSLRDQVYRHVMALSPADSAHIGSGGLITRMTNDVNQIQAGVNMAIRLATRVPFLAIGSIVMSFLINAKIGLIFLCATLLIACILYILTKKTLPGYGDIQAGQDTLSSLAGENLAGVRVIRAFSRQEKEEEDFDKAGDDLTALLVRVGRLSALMNPLTTVVANISILFVVWLGAGLVNSSLMLNGEIIALVNYMNQILLALIVAANLIVLFTRALASVRRVSALLALQPSITDGPGAVENPSAPAIRFDDVCFRYYKEADDAICNISFYLERGETLGIIGGTGSGKSTLVQLILRYFDTTKGAIEINGAPIQSYSLHALRGKIGYVPQTARLFTGSVRRNLQISAPAADNAALWQALETAQAADFVRKMPEGLDSLLEEGASNLSGGQRQRLTIARALVRRPEILILDDASSALDFATDAALRKALETDAKDTTVILISQRAAALKDAAWILLLDDGALSGAGKHEDLYAANEIYKEICQSQGLSI